MMFGTRLVPRGGVRYDLTECRRSVFKRIEESAERTFLDEGWLDPHWRAFPRTDVEGF
jgi:hypothetical protein